MITCVVLFDTDFQKPCTLEWSLVETGGNIVTLLKEWGCAVHTKSRKLSPLVGWCTNWSKFQVAHISKNSKDTSSHVVGEKYSIKNISRKLESPKMVEHRYSAKIEFKHSIYCLVSPTHVFGGLYTRVQQCLAVTSSTDNIWHEADG